jgi:hypothetical protein
MTFSEIKTWMHNTFGRDGVDFDSMIEEEIDILLQSELPNQGLRPFAKYDDTITTTVDQRYVLMPLDYKDIIWIGIADASGGDYNTLDSMSFEEFENADTDDTGEPSKGQIVFHTSGRLRLYFDIIPDDTYYLAMWYYAKEESVDGTDSWEANLSKIYGDRPLLSGVALHIAERLVIPDYIAVWQNRYKRDKADLLAWQTRQRKLGVVSSVNRGLPYGHSSSYPAKVVPRNYPGTW